MPQKKEPTNCLAGWRCPNCGDAEKFRIDRAVQHLTVYLSDDGTEDGNGGVETDFPDDASCSCLSCGHAGTVKDFLLATADTVEIAVVAPKQTKTELIKELAREAISIQDASNLCGLSLRYHEVLCELSKLGLSNDQVARHSISKLWLMKLADLGGLSIATKYTNIEYSVQHIELTGDPLIPGRPEVTKLDD
jgi:hypothetical protein